MNDPDLSLFLNDCAVSGPLHLHLTSPDGQEAVELSLPQPFALIGRDPSVDVALNHPLVSRRHAFVHAIAGRIFCVDLQSRTGTRWGNQTERSGWLRAGQTIGIGPYTLQADMEPAADAPALSDWSPLTPRALGPVALPEVALEFLNGQTRQPLWPMRSALVLVGRLPGCQVRLVEANVSRFHCSLLRTARGVWVVDLHGRQGVKVNGDPIRQARVADGDQLQVGRFLMRVHCRPSAAEGTPRFAPGEVVSAVTLNGSSHGTDPLEPEPFDAGPAAAADPVQAAAASLPSIFPAREMLPAATGRALERTELNDSLLIPLLSQFNQIQQQMFDQFHQSVLMVVQMFSALHRDQMGLIREELDRLHLLTDELHSLQAELARHPVLEDPAPPAEAAALPVSQLSVPDNMAAELLEQIKALIAKEHAAGNGRPAAPRAAPPPAEPARPPRPAERKLPAATPAATPPARPPAAAGQAPAASSGLTPNEEIHTWLAGRIASIQQERESRWQKILQFMLGK